MAARILIAEDNNTNLELMIYLLTAFGYQPYAARNGRQVLQTATREGPDLIVCDLEMPGVDGYEVARHLKNDPRLRRIPLVAVTAFAMAGAAISSWGRASTATLPSPSTRKCL